MLVTRNRRVAITMMSFCVLTHYNQSTEKEMEKDNTVVNAQSVIDIMSHIDKSLQSVVVDSSLSFLSSFKSCFDMMKSPEEQIRLVRYICSVLESSDPSCIPPPASGSASTNPCSPYPSPPHDERKEKEDMITNLLHEIHKTQKALSYLLLFQDEASSFFDIWRKSSDAEKEVIAKKIVHVTKHVTKQKKRKREEEEAKRQEREAKEAIDLKWLLKACDSGEKASELLSLMSLDPTVTESLIHKFCIAVVKSGKCDRIVVDRVVIDKCKSNPF